jgi:hypothetical protein
MACGGEEIIDSFQHKYERIAAHIDGLVCGEEMTLQQAALRFLFEAFPDGIDGDLGSHAPDSGYTSGLQCLILARLRAGCKRFLLPSVVRSVTRRFRYCA